MTSPVSIAAYHAIPNLEDRQARVYSCIKKYPGASSNDVARIEKMDKDNVRSRVSELKKMGLITSVGKQRDRLTGYTVYKYEAIR